MLRIAAALMFVIALHGETVVRAQVEPEPLPPGVTMAMVERGRILFEGEGLCVNCHGAFGKGLIGPDLTDAEWLQAKGNYLSIVELILDGVSEEASTSGVAMPARGGSTMSDEDVQSVAAFVWRMAHPEYPDSLPLGVTPEMLERGRIVFGGSGRCYSCHGTDASGGVGPDLTDGEWRHVKGSYLTIMSQILNGVPEDRAAGGIPMPPLGGSALTTEQVQDVAAYVWYIAHRH